VKAGNLLFHAAAAEATLQIPRDRALDFVYLDPPYGVGTEMVARTKAGEARGRKRPGSSPVAYRDNADVDALVAMISESAAAIRERMAPAATFCVHLDQRAVHEAKVALDRVFGRGAFLGEVIWTPGNGARGKGIAVTHQTLLFYVRSADERRDAIWNHEHPLLREPFAETSLSMHFKSKDDAGRAYRDRTINGKTYRYYADEGRRLGSVWVDIPAMVANTPLMKEGTGYPTQKPEKLLERLIVATTKEGDTVGDFMCGSGTTLAVAHKLGRSFIGGDVGDLAIETTLRRLKGLGATVSLVR
jgi:site-specific DNA-methyltransferase (adenine-specific)